MHKCSTVNLKWPTLRLHIKIRYRVGIQIKIFFSFVQAYRVPVPMSCIQTNLYILSRVAGAGHF